MPLPTRVRAQLVTCTGPMAVVVWAHALGAVRAPAGGLATEEVTRRLQLYIPAVPAVTAPVLLQPLLLYTAGEAMSASLLSLQSGGAGQVSLERLQECLRAAAAGLLDCGGVQLGVVHSQHPGRVPGARPQVRVTPL